MENNFPSKKDLPALIPLNKFISTFTFKQLYRKGYIQKKKVYNFFCYPSSSYTHHTHPWPSLESKPKTSVDHFVLKHSNNKSICCFFEKKWREAVSLFQLTNILNILWNEHNQEYRIYHKLTKICNIECNENKTSTKKAKLKFISRRIIFFYWENDCLLDPARITLKLFLKILILFPQITYMKSTKELFTLNLKCNLEGRNKIPFGWFFAFG